MRRAGRKNCSTQAYSDPRTRSSSSSVIASFASWPTQEHGVLLPDRERGAVELEVAPQEVLVERPDGSPRARASRRSRSAACAAAA